MTELKLNIPRQPINTPVYKCGDYFLHRNTALYILTKNEKKVVLVNLSTGNIWTDPVLVEDTCSISVGEFDQITTNKRNAFVLVDKLEINIL